MQEISFLSELENERLKSAISKSQGNFTKIDTAILLELVYFSAIRGNAMAQYCMGNFYSADKTGVIEKKEAIKWFKTAGSKGNVNALKALLKLYKKGNLPYGEIAEIINNFPINQSADPKILYLIGKVYIGKKAFELAFKYIKMSAKDGYSKAAMILIEMYYKGYGSVDSDPQKAFKILKALADKGYAPAQNRLAKINENGLTKKMISKYFNKLDNKDAIGEVDKLSALDGIGRKKKKKTKKLVKKPALSEKYLINI